jgi:mannosyl-3-phosphoglycerate synthase
MRLRVESGYASIGNVAIHNVARVIQVDAGHVEDITTKFESGNIRFSRNSLYKIEYGLAIVIPCMNEDASILDGVLHGVPQDVLIIVVSNSEPENFQAECDMFAKYCRDNERPGVIVHQKDEPIAQAFLAAGLPDIVQLDSTPLRIRNGKGEAMMIGVILAQLVGMKFIGFIDADNLVAGSVHEYCKVYAAGLHYALHLQTTDRTGNSVAPPRVMVRIKWNSKPKVCNGAIVFEPSGRSSVVVNKWMNRLVQAIAPTAPEALIQTGNAGEHAMSLSLAMSLRFSTGYAVEPFQLIDACERLDNVDIVQVQTRNPHFHDISKGGKHIERMQVQGLSTIFHSSLTPPDLKEDLKQYLAKELPASLNANGEPDQARMYPPILTLNFDAFEATLATFDGTLRMYGDPWDSHHTRSG